MFKKKQDKNEKAALPRAVRKQVVLYAALCIGLVFLAMVLFSARQKLQNEVKDREAENEAYQVALADVENLQTTLKSKRALVEKNGNTGWWLRTTGHSADDEARVSSIGKFINFQVNWRFDTVRPALWVDLTLLPDAESQPS